MNELNNSLITIIALIGGLSGSILTVLIEKILDHLTLRTRNKHEIKKLFFEKKLKAAESASAQWLKVASATASIEALYKTFSIEKNLD